MAARGKKIEWEADTLDVVRELEEDTRKVFGTELRNLQMGNPTDTKPFKTVGAGCFELRVWAADGTYRAFIVSLVKDTYHVLHVFEKKSDKTSRADVQKGKARYKALKERLAGEKKKR